MAIEEDGSRSRSENARRWNCLRQTHAVHHTVTDRVSWNQTMLGTTRQAVLGTVNQKPPVREPPAPTPPEEEPPGHERPPIKEPPPDPHEPHRNPPPNAVLIATVVGHSEHDDLKTNDFLEYTTMRCPCAGHKR